MTQISRIGIFLFILGIGISGVQAQETPTATPTPTFTPVNTPTPTAGYPPPANLKLLLNGQPWNSDSPIHLNNQWNIRLEWDAVTGISPMSYEYVMTGPGFVLEATRTQTWIRPFVHPLDSAHGGNAEDEGRSTQFAGTYVWSVQARDANGLSGTKAEASLTLTAATPSPTPLPGELPNPDQNSDGNINWLDYFILVSHWMGYRDATNATVRAAYSLKADLENDGIIDRYDILQFREALNAPELSAPQFTQIEVRLNNAGVPPRTIPILNPVSPVALKVSELANASFHFEAVPNAVSYRLEMTGPKNYSLNITQGTQVVFPLNGTYVPTIVGTYQFTLTAVGSTGYTSSPSIPLTIILSYT